MMTDMIMETPLDLLDIKDKTTKTIIIKALKKVNIKYIGELYGKDSEYLMSIDGIGYNYLHALIDALKQFDIKIEIIRNGRYNCLERKAKEKK